jgi:hypothetical protein
MAKHKLYIIDEKIFFNEGDVNEYLKKEDMEVIEEKELKEAVVIKLELLPFGHYNEFKSKL